MNDINGIEAFKMHQLKSRNDSTWTRQLIEGYDFINIAEVTKYDAGYVDCIIGSFEYNHVEVLVLGINGFGIKMVPAVGDRVMLITPRVSMASVEDFKPAFTMPGYDISGIKCIPLTDKKSGQLITVDKDGFNLSFSDSSENKNSLIVNKDGFTYTDTNGNVISSASNNITLSVNDGCSAEITNEHILFTGKNGKVEIK